VFIIGILKAFSLWIPVGGHTSPMSPTGLRAKWKKVQKNLKNSITSLKINSIIPSLREDWVLRVCDPRKLDSRLRSRLQVKVMSRSPKIEVIIPA